MTSHDALHAIYIDFECLATKPPHPALLGVLGRDDHFEQLIVDPKLASARVATGRMRVVDARRAIAELLEHAEAEDRFIIGWSFFDRDVAIRIAPDLEGRLRDRYRNAIPIARRWRQVIHPTAKIAAAGPFAAKHTLDKYAALARYPEAPHLVGATPAKWIRHILNQLEANDGRYRRVTSETKRDWHKLLEYNRHDCRALWHIVVKASAELESWRSFQKTIFCVREDRREVCFTVGSTKPAVQQLLERHRASRWAFMTAWNPAPMTLSRGENDRRQTALIVDLEGKGYRFLPGTGRAADGSWEEESLMVLNISRGAAVALGRKYEQLAIVVATRGGAATLVSCA